MKPETVTAAGRALESASDADTAHTTRKQVQPLRGIRGVSQGVIAKTADEIWRTDPPRLPDDRGELDRLFMGAWEDGLVAIALLAALVPDAPQAAADLAEEWLARSDDLLTADAIGWMVLGPAAIAGKTGARDLVERMRDGRALERRAAVVAGLAWTPSPLEGATAAAVRARLATPVVQWVAELDEAAVRAILDGFVRDTDPSVQKGLRRLIRRYAEVDPEAAVAWAAAVRGGLPPLLRDELRDVKAALAKRARKAAKTAEEA